MKLKKERGLGCLVCIISAMIVFLFLLAFCSCGGPPRLVTLQVDTKPAQDIYFDTFWVGTGTATIQVFTNVIPNYLEMRDIITGDVVTRLLLFQISNLDRILLQYGSVSWRDKRIQVLTEYIQSMEIPSDSLNGQNAAVPARDPDPELVTE